MVQVRRVSSGDSLALHTVDPGIARESSRVALIERSSRCEGLWVAELDGVAVGYLCRTREFFDNDFIALIVVGEAQRRQGVATALMQAAEAACSQDRIFTSTNESNAAMRALLRELGYVPSGRIENLDPGDAELVFVKFLRR